MKLLVAGSRDYNNFANLEYVINQVRKQYNITSIISGCARGVDTLAIEYAQKYNLKVEKFPADWNKFGRSAGYIRNKEMVKVADILVAVWKNRSPGTGHTIELARKKGIPRVIVESK